MVTLTNVVNQEFTRHISTDFGVIPPALLLPKVALKGGSAAQTQVRYAVTTSNLLLVLRVLCEEDIVEGEVLDLERS